jgi:hypothetical protein
MIELRITAAIHEGSNTAAEVKLLNNAHKLILRLSPWRIDLSAGIHRSNGACSGMDDGVEKLVAPYPARGIPGSES